MDDYALHRYTDTECEATFADLFPQGFAGQDVLDELGPDGLVVDIGSFRGAGGFIADCINCQIGGRGYDYIDFYMGTIWLARRADLTPVYRMIFRRLKAYGYDWTYHFPKLELVDLRPLRDALREPEGEEWNQEASVQEEDEEHDRSLHELRESLDTTHRERRVGKECRSRWSPYH